MAREILMLRPTTFRPSAGRRASRPQRATRSPRERTLAERIARLARGARVLAARALDQRLPRSA